jgi:hypothetical protein
MSIQTQLRLTIPQAVPRRFAHECDYCGRLALVNVLGDSVVCDKCLGRVETVAPDELEQVRR